MLPYENFNYVGLEDRYTNDVKGNEKIVVIGSSSSEDPLRAETNKIYSFSYKKPDDVLFYNVTTTQDVEINSTIKWLYQEINSKDELKRLFDESFVALHEFITRKKSPVIYYIALNDSDVTETIQLLEYIEADYVLFHNIYFNEISWVKLYAFQECFEQKEEIGQIMHAFFVASRFLTKPTSDYLAVKEKIALLNQSKTLQGQYAGKYFTVICNQLHDGSSAVRYLQLVLDLMPGYSPGGMPIFQELDQDYETEEHYQFYQAGIVSYKAKFQTGPVAASGTCAISDAESPSKQIANMIIAKMILNEMQDIQNPFVGYHDIEDAAERIEEKTREMLSRLEEDNIIRNYQLQVSYERITGTINCEIETVPIYAIRRVTQFSQLRVRV